MTDNKGSPDFPTRREAEEPRFCDSQRSFTVSLAAVIHVSHEPLLICPAFEPLFPPLLKPLQTMLKTQDILQMWNQPVLGQAGADCTAKKCGILTSA